MCVTKTISRRKINRKGKKGKTFMVKIRKEFSQTIIIKTWFLLKPKKKFIEIINTGNIQIIP